MDHQGAAAVLTALMKVVVAAELGEPALPMEEVVVLARQVKAAPLKVCELLVAAAASYLWVAAVLSWMLLTSAEAHHWVLS